MGRYVLGVIAAMPVLLVGCGPRETPRERVGTTRVPLEWVEVKKLTASDAQAGDEFGAAMSASGDTVLVGAAGADGNNADSGAAYVFVRSANTWTEQQKLFAADGQADDEFGGAVALSANAAVVGAWRCEVNGSNSGAAYVFVRTATNWTEQQKLTPSDGESSDQFGWSVSLGADEALVGARLDDDLGNNAGSAYVFVRDANSWIQQPKLTADDGGPGDYFGDDRPKARRFDRANRDRFRARTHVSPALRGPGGVI